jgi:hypothetical protein
MDTDDALPMSALAHLLYCERRAALVHVVGAWADNGTPEAAAPIAGSTSTRLRWKRGEPRGLGLFSKIDHPLSSVRPPRDKRECGGCSSGPLAEVKRHAKSVEERR